MSFVVFAGQSNMGGPFMDASTLTAPWAPDPLTLIWDDAAKGWQQMQPGMNTGYGSLPNTWGPEVEFAREFRAMFPNEVLRIVKSVAGGTGLAADPGQGATDWSPQSSGELFDTTRALIADAGATLHGLRPDIVLFGQGEEDSANAAKTAAYGDNLSAFLTAVRSQWMSNPNGQIGFFRIDGISDQANAVRAAQLRVDESDPNALSFDTNGYPLQADNLHFSAAGYDRAGAGFFKIYAAQPGAGSEADSGSDFVIYVPIQGGTFHGDPAVADVFGFAQAPYAPAHLAGFTPGQDRIDLSAVFQQIAYTGSDPVADHIIILQSDGQGGTQILLDRDGLGSGQMYGDYIISLDGVPSAGLTWAQLSLGQGGGGGGGGATGPQQGSAGGDNLTATAARPEVHAGLGDDTITGAAVPDYLRGDEGDDVIRGGPAFDDINGNAGNDVLYGGNGDDWVVGGKDSDVQFGDAGNDIVWGNLGNDTLDGGDGGDQVRGGQGDDLLTGGAGDDYVSGDRGNDTISGGAGADLFHGSQDAGIDRVLDFHLWEGDRVMLDPGTTYALSQAGADTLIDMGGGHQMILLDVQLSALTAGWIFQG